MPGATVSSTPAASPTGFFGKLPSRGDFIARHLPRAFLDPWDTWLQKAIACSRQQLGGAWRECYCTSPIWRFALGAGVCGPRAYAGVLMPSVDRVGRYYPLVIAAPLAPDRPLLTLPTSATDWFERAESLALLGLERDDLALDAFEQQVAALGSPLIAGPDATDGPGAAWYCPLHDESLAAASQSPLLAAYLLRRGFPQPSLWWTEGSDRIARCLLVCDGLPPVSGFAALLSGDWRQAGWEEKPLVRIDPPSSARATAAAEEQP